MAVGTVENLYNTARGQDRYNELVAQSNATSQPQR